MTIPVPGAYLFLFFSFMFLNMIGTHYEMYCSKNSYYPKFMQGKLLSNFYHEDVSPSAVRQRRAVCRTTKKVKSESEGPE